METKIWSNFIHLQLEARYKIPSRQNLTTMNASTQEKFRELFIRVIQILCFKFQLKKKTREEKMPREKIVIRVEKLRQKARKAITTYTIKIQVLR